MEALRNNLKKELTNLEVEETEEISIKMIEKKFKKKALKVHPDKTGKNDDTEFKELLDDFRKVQTKLMELQDEDGDDKGDICAFFEKNNVATELSQSWTVLVEKDKAESWGKALKKKFGEPKVVNSGSGYQFKAPVGDYNVSVTLYKSPSDQVPKMSIQGSKISLRHFVSTMLPEIYKQVCEKESQTALTSCSDDPTHTCNICGKVYKQIRRLTTHMEVKHTGYISEIKQKVITKKKRSTAVIVGPQTIPNNYNCSICGETFQNRMNILMHKKKIHFHQNNSDVKEIVHELIGEALHINNTPTSTTLALLCQQTTKPTSASTTQNTTPFTQRKKQTTQNTQSLDERQDVIPSVEWLTTTNEDLDEMLKMVNADLDKEENKCDICDITYNSGVEMAEHISNKHIKVTCDSCSEEFNMIKTLEDHKKLKHSNSNQEPIQEIPICDLCGIMLHSDQQIEEHVISHTEGPYICSECAKPFKSVVETEEHMKNVHSDPSQTTTSNVVFLKPAQCKKCEKYEDEKNIELKDKEAMETEYERLFINHNKLKDRYEHQVVQNQERLNLYKENKELREEAKNSQELLQKVMQENQVIMDELTVKNQIIEANEKLKELSHDIQIENETVNEEVQWLGNDAIRHNRIINKCDKCPYKTTDSNKLKTHREKHTTKFRCETCNEEFFTRQKLNEHIKSHHNKNDTQRAAILNTVSSTKMKCRHCDKEFENSASLMQHTKSKHESSVTLPVGHPDRARQQNDAVFECPQCPAQCKTRTDLNLHMITHSRKGIECQECEEMFETKSDLNHHMRTNHNGFQRLRTLCRYFLQGRCTKGNQCKFEHSQRGSNQRQYNQSNHNNQHNQQYNQSQYNQTNFTPQCKRGQMCPFLAQGSCNFFHPGIGVQCPRNGKQSQNRTHTTILCHFQERCQNQDSCKFAHEDFGMRREFLENY